MKLLEELNLFVDHRVKNQKSPPGVIDVNGVMWTVQPFVKGCLIIVTISRGMVLVYNTSCKFSIFDTVREGTIINARYFERGIQRRKEYKLPKKRFEQDHMKWIQLMLRDNVMIDDLLLYDIEGDGKRNMIYEKETEEKLVIRRESIKVPILNFINYLSCEIL